VTSDTKDASGGRQWAETVGGDSGRRQWGETVGGDQEEDDGDKEEVLPDGGQRRARTPAFNSR